MLRIRDDFIDKFVPTPKAKEYYLIGSLRNERISEIGNTLRASGINIFDSWFAAGPLADDCWRDYEQARGHDFPKALRGYAAQHVFEFDKRHLDRTDGAILCLPAGRSGHLELGYVIGSGKPGYILMEGEPERFDVMYAFTQVHGGGVFYDINELIAAIKQNDK